MLEVLNPFQLSALVIACLMATIWLLSLWQRDASIVDMFWGAGFVVVVWFTQVIQRAPQGIEWLLPILATIWGGRLTLHLTARNLGEPEDFRYVEMRDKWGSAFPIVSLFTVYILQGTVMWVVSLPLQVTPAGTTQIGPVILGSVLWAVGLFFEAVGDLQLTAFRAQPENRGQVLDTGLWRYTRHPNYFGDTLVWWGLYFVSGGLTGQWWTWIGPAIMTIFLLRISGVSLLERSLTQSKPQYAAYQARTSAFFPLPPRSGSE